MLVIESQCTRFNTMADGSGRLQFDTGELSPEQFSEIGRINKKLGILTFHPDRSSLSEEEKKAISDTAMSSYGGPKDRKKKSKSQVLRSILFKMWEKDDEGFKTQGDHYDYYMDQLIKHFERNIKE